MMMMMVIGMIMMTVMLKIHRNDPCDSDYDNNGFGGNGGVRCTNAQIIFESTGIFHTESYHSCRTHNNDADDDNGDNNNSNMMMTIVIMKIIKL